MPDAVKDRGADPMKALVNAGVSLWLDGLPETPGTFAMLTDRYRVSGVTTNPSIFARAVKNDFFASQLRELRAEHVTTSDAIDIIMVEEVQRYCDQLRGSYDATGGVDGRVSIEVNPYLADDTDATIHEACRLWQLVKRPNLFVKIPATAAGIPAITACLAEGISINVTLIFALTRYEQVQHAFLDGLDLARSRGLDLRPIASVASFFVSRVDAEVDARLVLLGATRLGGRAGLANARLAYQRYERMLASSRWRELQAAGAHRQRPLWASTSTKDPSYPDTMYVTGLVAPRCVNTMPEATMRAVADHGVVPPNSIDGRYREAKQDLRDLEAAGIGYDDVVSTLQRQGVSKFQTSWDELTSEVEAALRPATAVQGGA